MDYQGNYPSLGPGFEPNTLKAKKGIPLPIFLFLLASLILAGVSMMRFPKAFRNTGFLSKPRHGQKTVRP